MLSHAFNGDAHEWHHIGFAKSITNIVAKCIRPQRCDDIRTMSPPDWHSFATGKALNAFTIVRRRGPPNAMSLATHEERVPSARRVEADTWRFDSDVAPLHTPLAVRVPFHMLPSGADPDRLIAFRTHEGWRLLADGRAAALTQNVVQWKALDKAPAAVSSTSFISRLWRQPLRYVGGRAPNTFTLGAGKCGTTSLHAILRQHPDIHASTVKEPTFFCDGFQVVRDPAEYFHLFNSPAPVRLESSHAYLTNPGTADTLRTLFPDAKFLLILRDPKNRAYSLWRHMRRLKHEFDQRPCEDIPDFAAALKAEPQRFASRAFAENCRQYVWNFFYCRSSFYDEQIERYFALFDRSQFHVVSLAELSFAPIETVQEIVRFLGLDPAPVKHFNFEAKNRTRSSYRAYCGESDKIMSAAFEGLTDRTDRLVGRCLDWSA